MIDWDTVSKSLGFPREQLMWEDLYTTKNLPISSLAKKFNVSTTAIRTCLIRCEIQLRERGGKHRGVRIPTPVDLEEQIQSDGIQAVALRLGISPSGVYKRLYNLRRSRGEAHTTRTEKPSGQPSE